MFRAAKHYLAKAEKIIGKELSHLSKTVIIYIDYSKNVIGESNFDKRKFSEEQKNKIPHIIADFIRCKLTSGNVPKPSFISQVQTTPNKVQELILSSQKVISPKQNFQNNFLNALPRKKKRPITTATQEQ
jgi:hypothetical protein